MSIWSGSKSKTYAPYQKMPDEYKGKVDPYYAKIFSPGYYDYLLGDVLAGTQTQRAGVQREMEQNLELRGLSRNPRFAGYERSKLDRSYLSNIINARLKAKAMEEERRRLALSGITGMFSSSGLSRGAGLGHGIIGGIGGLLGKAISAYLSKGKKTPGGSGSISGSTGSSTSGYSSGSSGGYSGGGEIRT